MSNDWCYWPEKNWTTGEPGFVVVAPSGARTKWYASEEEATQEVCREQRAWHMLTATDQYVTVRIFSDVNFSADRRELERHILGYSSSIDPRRLLEVEVVHIDEGEEEDDSR